MSQAGLLERHIVRDDEAWIDVVPVGEPEPAPAAVSVLDAIFSARSALSKGIVREITIDTDALPEIDELDDAAIRAFFGEND